MKFLVFSDLHLDSPFGWARPELAKRRRQGLRDTLRRIVALAEEEQVDAILCAGDLYEHEHFTPDTVRFVAATFNGAGRPVYLAPGNHDWYGPASLYRQAQLAGSVHVFTEDRLRPVELADGLTLWGAAHLAPANTDGFLDGFRAEGDGVHLALFHGSENSGFRFEADQGKRPHAPFEARSIPAAGLAHAFVGHFHTPKLGDWHTYPGNPDPLVFGEAGERGAVIATVGPDGRVQRCVRRVATTRVQEAELVLRAIDHADQVRDQARELLSDLDGIVRLTVSGEVAPDVAVDRDLFAGVGPGLDGLVVRFGDLRTAYDFDRLRSEQSVRGQFIRDVEASDLDSDTKRRAIITGLRALDGRSDLEVV